MSNDKLIKQAQDILSQNNLNYQRQIISSHKEKELFRSDSYLKFSARTVNNIPELDPNEPYANSSVGLCQKFYVDLLDACKDLDKDLKQKIGLNKMVKSVPVTPAATTTPTAPTTPTTPAPSTTPTSPPATPTSGSTSSGIGYSFVDLEPKDYFIFWNSLQAQTSTQKYEIDFGIAAGGGQKIVSVYNLGSTVDLDLTQQEFQNIRFSLSDYLNKMTKNIINSATKEQAISTKDRQKQKSNDFLNAIMNALKGSGGGYA